jgi:hypothetical protein
VPAYRTEPDVVWEVSGQQPPANQLEEIRVHRRQRRHAGGSSGNGRLALAVRRRRHWSINSGSLNINRSIDFFLALPTVTNVRSWRSRLLRGEV